MPTLKCRPVKSLQEYKECRGYKGLSNIIHKLSQDKTSSIFNNFDVKITHSAAECKDNKYIICSINNSEVDKYIIENNPFSLIEGMTIAAYASGANRGLIYVCNELTNEVETLKISIRELYTQAYLGKDILNSNFNFDLEIQVVEKNNYLFNEDLSLLKGSGLNNLKAAVPFAEAKEIWNKLTTINNARTYASIASAAAEEETFIFDLRGVENEGIVEAPVNTTLKDVIYAFGKGTLEGKNIKAINIGKNLGVLLPEEQMNITLERSSLKKHNIPSSFDTIEIIYDDKSVIDLISTYAEINKKNSCGKCIPCREGMTRISELVSEVANKINANTNIEKLDFLCSAIKDTALCEFGKTAVNPVSTTIKYFKEEYK